MPMCPPPLAITRVWDAEDKLEEAEYTLAKLITRAKSTKDTTEKVIVKDLIARSAVCKAELAYEKKSAVRS